MGGELKYEIEQNAYIKLVLHSLKHKTSAVNAILIGEISPQNDVVHISDSVPLFHTHLGLLPQLEISLLLIEEHYAQKGLSIVGYFHANERSDDYELGGVARNIGDHIYRYFPQAPILLLDNKKVDGLNKSKDRSPAMQLYVRDASKNWKLVQSDASSQLTIKEPSANLVLLDYISSEKWNDIVDFDDHLDDISKKNVENYEQDWEWMPTAMLCYEHAQELAAVLAGKVVQKCACMDALVKDISNLYKLWDKIKSDRTEIHN